MYCCYPVYCRICSASLRTASLCLFCYPPAHTQALAAVGHPPGEAWGEALLLALRPQLPSLSPPDLICLMDALAQLQVGMGVGVLRSHFVSVFFLEGCAGFWVGRLCEVVLDDF